jgi:hypothetical protein
MRLIAQIVRRATSHRDEIIEQPRPRARGKSPRARLREDALSLLT